MSKTPFTHINESGAARLVDVSEKTATDREAVARGHVRLNAQALEALREGGTAKGNVLAVARVAAIMAAKKADHWIPLCHSLPLSAADVFFRLDGAGLDIEARIKCHGRTGVEMEALAAVSVAALTVYDMCKALDKNMVIGPVYLLAKSGGRSGFYRRSEEPASRPDAEDPSWF
jgi:cyclic pyranopterin monophosphate synthase